MRLEEVKIYECQNDMLNKIVNILGLTNWNWLMDIVSNRCEKRAKKRFKFYQDMASFSDAISINTHKNAPLITEEGITLKTIKKRLSHLESESLIAAATQDDWERLKIHYLTKEYLLLIDELQKEFAKNLII